MRTITVPNDFVEIRFFNPRELRRSTACDFVSSCLGLRCASCDASRSPAQTVDQAKQYFEALGIREKRKSQHLVRIREPVNPCVGKIVCHWTVQCPRGKDLDTINCYDCPAEGEAAKVTFEEAIAWWKEAKLERSYR